MYTLKHNYCGEQTHKKQENTQAHTTCTSALTAYTYRKNYKHKTQNTNNKIKKILKKKHTQFASNFARDKRARSRHTRRQERKQMYRHDCSLRVKKKIKTNNKIKTIKYKKKSHPDNQHREGQASPQEADTNVDRSASTFATCTYKKNQKQTINKNKNNKIKNNNK